jgi:hypothetical protein
MGEFPSGRCVKIMDEAFASSHKDAIIEAIKANQRKVTGAN